MNYFSKNCKKAFQTINLEIDCMNDSKEIVDVYSILEQLVKIGKLKAQAVAYRKDGIVKCALELESQIDKINASLPDNIRI